MDQFGNSTGCQVLEVAQCERRDAAMASTASAKSQRKRLDWNDYFLQRSERDRVQRDQPRANVVKDIDSFQYVGRALDGPNDFQSACVTMQKGEFTRLIEDNQRATRVPQYGNTNASRVPLGGAVLRSQASQDGSGAEHHQRMFQSKIPSQCTPANVYNPQTWQDLISRTLNANDLIRGSAIHPSRKQQDNLKRTRKVLEPQLQDEVDVLGNKITGCKKKVLNKGGQTFQIGQQH